MIYISISRVWTAKSLVPANSAALVQTRRFVGQEDEAKEGGVLRKRRLRMLAIPKTCLLALKSASIVCR